MPAFFVYLAYSFVSFRNLRWNRSPQKYQPAAHYPHSKAALFARTDRILLCGFHVLSFGEPDGRVAHLSRNDCGRGDIIRRTSAEPGENHEYVCARAAGW